MSLATSEMRLVGSGLALLPRVNLLPPEIEERRRFRQVQMGLGATLVAAVGIVGLLLVGANSSVSEAQGDLDTATATGSQLKVQAATFNDVTAVYERAAAAQAMLTEAMGTEVRWSRFMNDLSLSIPADVWITNLTYTQSEVPPAVGATDPGIGTATVSGVAFSHDDVASWLESLAGQKVYANPYFSNSTQSKIGERNVVNFSSTATLTTKALSGRYTKPAGG